MLKLFLASIIGLALVVDAASACGSSGRSGILSRLRHRSATTSAVSVSTVSYAAPVQAVAPAVIVESPVIAPARPPARHRVFSRAFIIR